VEALERYFGIPYPYRKLDIVAVPDFAAGAMENVGLITFREWLLLLDPARATEGQRRAFAYVMAHELAHQWFGNLVTMPWWNDIWLNEAFATWMGNKIVHDLHPEYRSDLASLASAHRAMDLDSLVSARSIRQPITNNHDIKNAFDAITYQKGGAVLSMFEHWMTPDTFRDGIRLYLNRHRLGTATSKDLLQALDDSTALDVAEPFRSFLTQPGVPWVRTARAGGDCAAGVTRIALTQERYLPIGSDGSAEQTWQLPLCVRSEAGTACALLDRSEGHLDLPGCSSWWMPNEDGAGYFRFAMSPEDWRVLRRRGLSKLSESGRIAVADSLYASFSNGSLDAKALLPWISRFSASPLRQVATGPMGVLSFMMTEGASAPIRPDVAAYAARLYRKRYRRLGWTSRAGDSSDVKLLREAVLRFLVMDVRDEDARARAARLGRAYARQMQASIVDAVDPQLAGLALATAVQTGDADLFDRLLAEIDSTAVAERSRILVALGHAETPELSDRALDLALDPELRLNEISSVLRPQFGNPRTRDRAWRWLIDHFDDLVMRIGPAQAGSIPFYAISFCSYEAARDVRRFLEPRMRDAAGGPRNLATTVEAIELCAAKVETQRPGIDRAFGR
jgi:alanyl aminopeptidase